MVCMNRLHITILVLVRLLSQWGGLEHDYHVHDSSDVCDYCLGAQALDHAISSTVSIAFSPSYNQFQPELSGLVISLNNIRYYSVRAPPRFI